MRVALIAVHGVADQERGATADAIAALLVDTAPAEVRYVGAGSEEFVLPVEPLADPAETRREPAEAEPKEAGRRIAQAARQSFRSDFHAESAHEPAGSKHGETKRPADVSRAGAQAALDSDLGIEATSYLLRKARREGAASESYASTKIQLERHTVNGTTGVDLYEMYWADLSRLSGALPRIITELFTLVFRLSKLGRETVDSAQRHFAAEGAAESGGWVWRIFPFLQRSIDWAFVNLLAQFFMQLALLGLLLVIFGAARQHPWVFGVTAGAAVAVGLAWLVYLGLSAGMRLAAPVALLFAGIAMFVWPTAAPWCFGAIVLGVVTAVYDVALRIGDDRFPLVRFSGLAVWCAPVVAMLTDLVVTPDGAIPAATRLVQLPLVGVEIVITFMKWWWIVGALAVAAWAIGGALAGLGGRTARASVDTGRLGLLASMGTFLMLAMAIWALLVTPLEWAVDQVDYTPRVFVGDTTASTDLSSRCSLSVPTPPSSVEVAKAPVGTATHFLLVRYQNSTAAFSAVAALLLLLLLHNVLSFAPSLFAELGWLGPGKRDTKQPAATRLGRWLTRGLRLTPLTLNVVLAAAVIVAVASALDFAFQQGPVATWLGSVPLIGCVPWFSAEFLKPFVISAAGLTAALSAVGGLLSRYLPGLRAPLDVALDVDNYFREFPRKSIPRARIFSRYAALLKHVAAQHYDRIVIVSHSQGTIISAELLRFLSTRTAQAVKTARREALRGGVGADVSLLTLGSPLRQLYAARFPSLYQWVLSRRDAHVGPAADAIGAERWANAFTSGDYVGRWLWSSGEAKSGEPDPLDDTLQPPILGRSDAYALLPKEPPDPASLANLREFEVCLGAGAHTHYFERGQHMVAWLIDYLISAPRLFEPDAGRPQRT